MPRIFGHIAGVPPGFTWDTRREVAAAGVHKPTMNGISGTDREGADSVVVSGGYEDDEDHGTEIIYTGTGGYNPASGKQTSDQTLDNTNNAALVVSRLRGLPVRVVRGANGDKTYSPTTGYRYDGLFKVVDHWSETGGSGFRIWRFRLEQDEVLDNLPAPLVVALDPCAPSRGICVAGLVPEVRRRGNRHDGADRLDTERGHIPTYWQ